MKNLFCEYCQDDLNINTVVAAYDKLFCSPKCCTKWNEDKIRKLKFKAKEDKLSLGVK